MGQVYVIRKEGKLALPMGNNMMYLQGMENSGPKTVPGVNPQGMAGLQTNPMNQQYEAKPQMDASGKNEVGVYDGDKYGAQALNQMNRRNMKEGETRAIDAGQTAFSRGARYGQTGANVGRGLAAGIGVLAGAVNLANAGAQGQDAITGGLGAAQMGSVAYQQGKKPLSEAGGNVGAQIAANSVGVQKPIKPPITNSSVVIAPPTHTTDEMTNMRSGKEVTMSTDRHGNPVPFTSEAARRGADYRSNLNMGRDVDPKTNQSLVDHMGMPTEVGTEETGMVTGSGAQSTFPTGSQQRDEQAQAAANPVKVAPATTTTQTTPQSGAAIAAETGQSQLAGAPDPTQSGQIIDENTAAAKAMSGKKNSMTENGLVGKMVGVTGSKRMVGVY